MRRPKFLFFVLLLIFSACAGGGTSGTGGFGYKGEISTQSGQPNEGVFVSLESASGEVLGTATTSKNGTFSFGKITFSDAVIIVKLKNGTTTQVMISIPDGKNIARVTFKEKDGSLENTIQFEKDNSSQSSPASSSQKSVTSSQH